VRRWERKYPRAGDPSLIVCQQERTIAKKQEQQTDLPIPALSRTALVEGGISRGSALRSSLRQGAVVSLTHPLDRHGHGRRPIG
jgi:hypothetical protein